MQFFQWIPKAITRSATALALTAPFSTMATAGGDPAGVWLNDTGRGAVEIKRCGKNLCGHVVWVKDESDRKGCGRQIIGDAAPVGSGTWDNGWIYSPERRKTYDVELKPLSNGTLQVTGYAGVRFLSKTMIWTRAPADLKRCGETSVEAKADIKPVAPQAAVTAPTVKPGAPAAPAPQIEPQASPGPGPASAAGGGPKAPEAAAAAPSAVHSAPVAATPAPSPVTTAPPSSEPPATSADGGATGTPAPDNKAPAAGSDDGDAKTAEADNDEAESGPPPAPREKPKLKLGDLDLDKVFTRTKSGRCKLDLPFVKVQFDCERD